MKKTVALLLSDKRSGSTVFEEELCVHPDISHVRYTPHSYFETHYWVMAACVLRLPRYLFHGQKRVTAYGSSGSAKRIVLDCVRGNVRDFEPPSMDADFVVEVKDLSHLNRVVKAVKKVKGVLDVERREQFGEEDRQG